MEANESLMGAPTASGLDSVVVAKTALSDVDGEHGRLIIRGYSVEELAERATFEDVCALLWNGEWPSARVVASTGSDVISAVVAAIGALKGPLHGGVPGPVLDMLDAIGEAPRARAWLEAELAAGRRIMGMGHRVYTVRDPRAAALERAVTALEADGMPSVCGLTRHGMVRAAGSSGAHSWRPGTRDTRWRARPWARSRLYQ